jgi:hypothetical protein
MAPNAPVQQPVAARPFGASRVFLIIACVLFVIAAFVAGGNDFLTTEAWAWGFGGFASWVLSQALGAWGWL